MNDKFLPPLADLKASIEAGEDIETLIREIAEEHDLPPAALRNRATLAYGDLTTLRERGIQESERVAKDLEYDRARRYLTTPWSDDQRDRRWAETQWFKAWRYANPSEFERLRKDQSVRVFQFRHLGYKWA